LDGSYTFDDHPNRLTKETEQQTAELNQIERAVAQRRFGAIGASGNFDSLSQCPV